MQYIGTNDSIRLHQARERAALGFLSETARVINVLASCIVLMAELNVQESPLGARGSRGAVAYTSDAISTILRRLWEESSRPKETAWSESGFLCHVLV